MSIVHSKRPVRAERLATAARRLLDASTLCAIATASSDRAPYVNTAYFAWGPDLRLVWLSHPDAAHSRNVERDERVAVAVYDSAQVWGRPDRGIQLVGSARRLEGDDAGDAAAVYRSRFVEYRSDQFGAYRFYAFRPRLAKLFDERELGAGRFVVAAVDEGGRLTWEATEVYRAEP